MTELEANFAKVTVSNHRQSKLRLAEAKVAEESKSEWRTLAKNLP